MSRIGKKPIEIPKSVEVKIENDTVVIKGPKGELSREVRPEINVEFRDEKIFVSPRKSKGKNVSAFWGLTRALLANMVKGVTDGYEKKLEMQGIGYKARLEGKTLILSVGFSHEVNFETPEGLEISVDKKIIIVTGIDNQQVGLVAAKIRKIKPPEPYKGKGIRYLGEKVRRKAGKKMATGSAA